MGAAEMCDCPVPLMMRFWRGDDRVASLSIDDADDAAAHAAEFDHLDADRWQVVCPECGQHYAGGGVLSDDDQVDVLVVPRWNPFRQVRYVPGSSTDWRCSVCRRRVVLAPSSVRLHASQQVRVLCIECVPRYIEDHGVDQASVKYL